MRHPDDGAGRAPGGPVEGGGRGDAHLDEGTIHAWLDGALDEAEGAGVEHHVASCAACAAMVAEARGLVAAASRILTRLDDVPGGVLPAGAPVPESVAAAAAPPAAVELVRDVRRRRPWTPAAWGLSAALAAAAALLLVARSGDMERTLDDLAAPAAATSAPAAERAAAAPDTMPVPAPAPAVESAPSAGARREGVARPGAPREGRPGARVEGSVATTGAAERDLAGSGAGAPRVGASLAAKSVAAPTGAAAAREAQSNAVQQRTALELAAPIAAPVLWSDSLTRAMVPRRIGFATRILTGARLVESTMEPAERPERRRSVYELEDGERVTLVEGPSPVALEAVVVTSAAPAPAPGAETARLAQPQRARGADAAARAVAPPAVPESARADGALVDETKGGERIVVRPDGVTRLEWREGGAALSLEGHLGIDRLRALRGRVQ